MKCLAAVVVALVGSVAMAEDPPQVTDTPQVEQEKPKPPVTLKITCNQKDADVYVDNEQVGKVSEPVGLTPGLHKITVAKDGFWDQSVEFVFPTSGTKYLTVKLLPGISLQPSRVTMDGRNWLFCNYGMDKNAWTFTSDAATFKGAGVGQGMYAIRPWCDTKGYVVMISGRVTKLPPGNNVEFISKQLTCDGKWHTVLVAHDRSVGFAMVDGAVVSTSPGWSFMGVGTNSNVEMEFSLKDLFAMEITPEQYQLLSDHFVKKVK